MYNGIVFNIPTDGIKDNDNILIELTKDCDLSEASALCDMFHKIYPQATITMIHPDIVKSIHFSHKVEDYSSIFPF